MISPSLLSCHPKLRPHAFAPSEDDPREFILIDGESGAALGLSHTEKRLAELLDGQRSMAEILEKVIHDRLAPITTLRRFLWDLSRYGFLETSPWNLEKEPEGWGYWGQPDASLEPFWIFSLLGSAEKWLGRLLISPFFHVASFSLFFFSVWKGRNLLLEMDPVPIQDSIALGLLVILLTLLGGILVALWFGAMVLRALHPSPVRCVADYRYALPILRLDGRRLRAFPTRRALHYAVSPAVGLLLISSLFLFCATASEGARQDGMLHIATTLWLTIFLLVIPWNSTLLSREILLRLRGESVIRLMAQSIRRSIHFLLRSRLSGEPHETLALVWGIWAVLGSLIPIRLAALLLRWQMPLFINRILMEENWLALITLFVLISVLIAALAASILSLCLWLGRLFLREIRLGFWPERDYALAGLGLAAWMVFAAQFFWSLPAGTAFSSLLPVVFCGLALFWTAFRAMRSEGLGCEPRILLFPLLSGILLLVQSFHLYLGRSPYADFDENAFQNPFYLLLHAILFTGWIAYWFALYGRWFSPAIPFFLHRRRVLLETSVVILPAAMLLYKIPFPPGFFGVLCAIVFAGALVGMLAGSIGWGWVRNYSSAFFCAGSLLVYAGLLQPDRESILLRGPLVICLGTALSLCGFILRASAASKTALALKARPSSAARETWTFFRLWEELMAGARDLYNAVPALPLPYNSSDEHTRLYLNRLWRITGTYGLYVILRRTALSVPWNATRDLVKYLPATVPAPRLTDWSPEKIERWLRKIPTFAHLDNREMHALANRTRVAMFLPGERFIHQGQREGSLYVILQGSVSVEIERPFGNRILTVLSEEDFVGEIGFLCGIERTATVRAMAPLLLLCLHREDIDESTPTVLTALREAESGGSWIKAFCQATVFSEFPPSLGARICLESRHVQLDRGESLWLEADDLAENVAVFLLGKGSMIKDGQPEPLAEGTLVGLEASLAGQRMQGMIRAEEPSRILLVDRALFREALAELLTPECVLQENRTDSDRETTPNEKES